MITADPKQYKQSKTHTNQCVVLRHLSTCYSTMQFICISKLGYFFAVLITYNVDCVLNNRYRNFMARIFKNKKVIAFLIFMGVIYLLPLIMMYTNFTLSYGPVGFRYETSTLIFLCGPFTSENTAGWTAGLAVYMYFLPIAMFIYHALILLQVRRKRQKFLELDHLNSKQQFIIRSNWLSVLVFAIQAFNLIKQLLAAVGTVGTFYHSQPYNIFIIAINFIFDLYPVLLLLAIRRIQFRRDEELTGTMFSDLMTSSEA